MSAGAGVSCECSVGKLAIRGNRQTFILGELINSFWPILHIFGQVESGLDIFGTVQYLTLMHLCDKDTQTSTKLQISAPKISVSKLPIVQ